MNPPTIRLHLLRHAQTHSNVTGALDTEFPGRGLTRLGAAQADAAAQVLAEGSFDDIYVSRMVRTHETAGPLAAALGLEPVVEPLLAEIRAGADEMRNDPEAINGYVSVIGAWTRGELDQRMPGAETGRDFLQRYDTALSRITRQTRSASLVVCHGAAMRVWVANRVRAWDAHPSSTALLGNTARITVTGSPERGWSLLDWVSTPVGSALLEDEHAADPTALPTGGPLMSDAVLRHLGDEAE